MFDIDLSNLKAFNQKDFIMKQSQDFREKTNYNAFYMAVVVNSNDSEGLGRVQIRIPALHGTHKSQNYYVEDNELPWARPGIFATGGNDMGQFLVPQKGNRVFVTFEFNSPSNPIYFGGIPTLIGKVPKQYNDNPDIYNGNTVEITDNDKIKSKSKSKANQIVYKSFKGATIEINDKDGQESIKIIDASGQVFEMGVLDPEGVPLPRRGDKENSTNDYRFIKLGNENEFIEIIDGKIKIVADDVDISGYKPGGGDGADEVQISKEEPTKDSIELWVDLDDNTPPVPAEVVVDPDYVHTDNNFTDALKEKLEDIDLSDVGAIKIIKRNGEVLQINPVDKSVNIIVPTKLSEINNDNHTVTDENYVHTDNNFTSSDKAQINTNKESIMTLNSEVSSINTNINSLSNNKLDKNFTEKIVKDISVSKEDNTNIVKIKEDKINPSDGTISSEDNILPLASDNNAGIMPKESFSQINQNTNEINNLKQMGGRYIGVGFDTYAELQAYVIPDTVNENDFTFVRQDSTHDNATTRYIVVLENGQKKFEFAYVINEYEYGNFQTGVAGLIIGANEDGKVFAENDGTGSVVGWDNLKSGLSKMFVTGWVPNPTADGNNMSLSLYQYNPITGKTQQNNLGLEATTDTKCGLFTSSNKIKLDGIENNAQVNKIEKIKKNGTNIEIDSTDKSVNIEVPTKVSELENDSNYVGVPYVTSELSKKANVSHSHNYSQVFAGEFGYSGSVDEVSRYGMGETRSNKIAFMNPNLITIERSIDNGITWVESTDELEEKKNLVSMLYTRNSTPIAIRKEPGNLAVGDSLRITFNLGINSNYYFSLNEIFDRVLDYGHKFSVKIERAKKSNENEFINVRTNNNGVYEQSGWSGNNVMFFYQFLCGSLYDTLNSKIRMTFTVNQVNTSYIEHSPYLYDIRFFGREQWSNNNIGNMAYYDHLYRWDADQNAFFPAEVSANKFNGNATSASKLQTARKINGVNFDGTQDITIPLADVDSLTSQATSRTCDLPLDIT